jgi:hypothetical protein
MRNNPTRLRFENTAEGLKAAGISASTSTVAEMLMAFLLPLDLIATNDALGQIPGANATIAAFNATGRPWTSGMKAAGPLYGLIGAIVDAVRIGALEVVSINSRGHRWTLLPRYCGSGSLWYAQLFGYVAGVRGSGEWVICFRRSNWCAWLARSTGVGTPVPPTPASNSPPTRSPGRGRPRKLQNQVRAYLAEKYPNGVPRHIFIPELEKELAAANIFAKASTIGRASGRRRDAYRGSEPRPK